MDGAWSGAVCRAGAGASAACLHMGLENPAEVRRREDALAAARLINMAMERSARCPISNRLSIVGRAGRSRQRLRRCGGWAVRMGDLARRMQWGSEEPLPGWEIHHVTREGAYAFSLTDTRDPCGFTY